MTKSIQIPIPCHFTTLQIYTNIQIYTENLSLIFNFHRFTQQRLPTFNIPVRFFRFQCQINIRASQIRSFLHGLFYLLYPITILYTPQCDYVAHYYKTFVRSFTRKISSTQETINYSREPRRILTCCPL